MKYSLVQCETHREHLDPSDTVPPLAYVVMEGGSLGRPLGKVYTRSFRARWLGNLRPLVRRWAASNDHAFVLGDHFRTIDDAIAALRKADAP